ncbi:fumarylacetoacetase [Caulobacter sp. AP07]|uniref:fumarylacetoacetase n=1 Tax=Caulobacter sp. AP07 TaxID=1144304 RepID=UPI0002720C65|nr:fumarylacetoacetase [Caulobacter sp. AP07]EJL27346.1 fumarylacetoacetase [Caulobacter sp. AP07]
MIDHTHDSAARSWVSSANTHRDFPIQNLPLGVFSDDSGPPRCGVAIGDEIVDLAGLAQAGLLPAPVAAVVAKPRLNGLFALDASARLALRHVLFDLLLEGGAGEAALRPHLRAAGDCVMHLPARIGGYTDFYAGIIHATNVGRLLRPDNPLMPNYRYVPIGYHGRASSVRVSDDVVRRPWGQVRDGDTPPVLKPSQRLDYELELGLWMGQGNAQGEPIGIEDAASRLAGVSLLNDWSARDVQAWEYQPLGPFLAKNFASTVSPWVITMEALAPFRSAQPARPSDAPALLPYLDCAADQAGGALDIALEVAIRSPAMRAGGQAPRVVGRARATDLYWTPAQLVAHHTVGGCNLEAGDLLGTGTVSSPGVGGFGSLMEITSGGREPITLAEGEIRRFLEDGDEVVMTGRCERDGFVGIGFGVCRGTISAARTVEGN